MTKEVYNRRVCEANKGASEASRVPCSAPKGSTDFRLCFFFIYKKKSKGRFEPQNLLQGEALSKEVYNRRVCEANKGASEASRVPCSAPKGSTDFRLCFFFIYKKKSKGRFEPQNLLQGEALSKEVYNRRVCEANDDGVGRGLFPC